MLRFASFRKLGSISRRAATAIAVTLSMLGIAAFAGAQTVATYDFETGTQGWQSFAGASAPVQSNAAAYTGSNSLLTTTSASGSGGPSISVSGVLQAGGQYSITGWVRLTSGETASNANFTVRRTDPNCSGACYDTIGNYTVAVNDSGWAQIGGTYTPATTETGLTLYAQLVGASTAQSFYLDDVVITQIAPPPGGTPVASYTFSDGGVDGWTPFGPVTLTNAVSPVADPGGNPNSLLTTNRTAGYMGPSLNLLSVPNLAAGATYQVSAYVMLATADSSNPTVTMSTKTADCANAGAYGNIGTSGPLSNTAWTKVTGTFSFSNQPGPPTSLVLYFQSSSATDSFYISGVKIGELVPPPPDPGQQDNTGISSTFEDGGTDGWSSRSGSSSVTNSTAAANTGTHSLLVTGRIANWDGPQINVSNKMYAGSEYNLSAWVLLTPADGSTHTINMSMQTSLNGVTSYPGITSYPGVQVVADGAWHQISVLGYNMASNYDPGTARLYLQTVPSSGNDLVSFYVDDFKLTYVNPPSIQTNIPSIYQTLSQYFPVGAAVDMTDLTGPHQQLLNMHFNSMTPGNEMKWSSVEPAEGSFDFTNADSEVGLAVCHNMKVRGQNLVWATGQQTPSYATGDGTNSAANQAAVTSYIQEHIKSEVQHFGNKVYAWDVINEPIDPNQPDCLAHGPFYKVLGKSYMDVALQAARQYAPAGTKLFINDYSTTDPNKLACLVKVVADLKSRGIPLDGIGHEMHNAINYPSPAAMAKAIGTIALNFPDLDQQITELDMSVYNAGDIKSNYGDNVPPAVLAEQGWLYKDYFDLFRLFKHQLSAVTLWGMADDDTWLDGFPVARTDYPLPFDMGLQAKPAYWGIVDETRLPGYGLKFAASISAGTRDTRTITLTATNGDVGPAYATQVNGLSLHQISGSSCSPQITAPGSYPIALGDLPVSGTASATFTVSLAGCNPNAQWVITAPWSSATYETGTFFQVVDFNRGKDHE